MCPDAADRGPIADALRQVRISSQGIDAPIASVTFIGLRDLRPEQVWELVGTRPPTGGLDIERVGQLLVRLSRTGLFSEITPTLRVDEQAGLVRVDLEIAVREHPRINDVVVQGIDELLTADLIDVLLEVPDDDERDEAREAEAEGTSSCAAPLPPAEWLARDDAGAVGEGILWRGMEPALNRLARHLLTQGYRLASFQATLTADGTLVIVIDEGRIGAVDIRGVAPGLEPRVRALLGLTAGSVFLEADLDAGIDRVRREFPFLRTDRDRRPTRGQPRVLVEDHGSGAAVARLVETRCPSETKRDRKRKGSKGDKGDRSRRTWRWYVEGTIDPDRMVAEASNSSTGSIRVAAANGGGDSGWKLIADDEGWGYELMCGRRAHQLLDDTVVVHFRERRGDLDVDGVELFRHTPVTGYAPGLEIATVLWDGGDRAHLTLRSEFNLNTGRKSHDPAQPAGQLARLSGDDLLEQLSAQERVDWGLGASVRVPRMSLAELGVEVHSRTDTSDRWRIHRIDSYLGSMIANRPYADYYRRTGGSAFATFAPSRGLLLGAEYRYDRYDALASVDEPYNWFRRDEAGFPSAPIDEGTMGSALFRFEWATGGLEPRRSVGLGHIRRYAETSLLGDRLTEAKNSGLKTVTTLEIGHPQLGSDEHLHFVRLITDNRLHLATGDDQGLSLRARGEFGRDVPLQKRPALGGWGSLRGYDYKEFTGDAALLLGAEYHFGWMSAFAEVAALRNGQDWHASPPGVGLALHLGDAAEVAFAWRTDADARKLPQIRLLFGRPF